MSRNLLLTAVAFGAGFYLALAAATALNVDAAAPAAAVGTGLLFALGMAIRWRGAA